MQALISLNDSAAFCGEEEDIRFHIARQPICDQKTNIIGHELLCRHQSGASRAWFDDSDLATAEVFITALIDAGIEKLSQYVPLFVACPALDSGCGRHGVLAGLCYWPAVYWADGVMREARGASA
ncbi:hypothetical protein [Methylogaea oryzae]|uniref:EAL domain-containing protein n=1 Tax=Methylogaea oryzae TaxID=1295382 RepID=A0A8D5AM61_9GAMM|nr:hypothetical protein [Methylogaea oryzae]BBL72841.1 hypothetical protein MoryE10_34470 [Methylogaea oryzae]